jgi:hypothetical protein
VRSGRKLPERENAFGSRLSETALSSTLCDTIYAIEGIRSGSHDRQRVPIPSVFAFKHSISFVLRKHAHLYSA